MGLTDTVFGSPGETTIHQTPAMRPPGFSWAKNFFNSLGNLSRQPYPVYPGQLDPGLSPTMQEMLRRAQGYAQSGPPEILAGVQGSLGRFMNPSFINPQFRIPMGMPNYFPRDPNQRIFGGRPVGQMGGAFGMMLPQIPPAFAGEGGGAPPPGNPMPMPMPWGGPQGQQLPAAFGGG